MIINQGQNVAELTLLARQHLVTLLEGRTQQTHHRLKRRFAFTGAEIGIAHALL
ncbi:Uncharacterised protein [Enterobacter cloacae]|nr:Uncharacterised protein [Enterobacter cloacae]